MRSPHVWAAQFLRPRSASGRVGRLSDPPPRPPRRTSDSKESSRLYAVHVLGTDGIWREYHVFGNRADAERSVTGFEADGFRAKIYRTASWPIEKDANVQGDHRRQQVNAAG